MSELMRAGVYGTQYYDDIGIKERRRWSLHLNPTI